MADKFKLQNRRYIGSKYRLLDWIHQNVQELTNGSSFFDVFAGTGVVAQRFLSSHKRIILNDFLYSNEVIYQAFFNSNDVDFGRVQSFASNIFQAAKSSESENYFQGQFGGKFFSKRDARVIGFIRQSLDDHLLSEAISKPEFNVLLASLIYSADKISNTVGHYDAYIRAGKLADRFSFSIIENLDTSLNDVEIMRDDANLAAARVVADVAFVDPPYNSRQYSRFYHVLENLAEWKKPRLYGVARKPDPQNMSDYSRKSAPQVFAELVAQLNCRYLVVTYNNTFNSKSSSSRNKITLEQITRVLEDKGETHILSVGHRFFNSGKTAFDAHKEFLFVTEVAT